MIKSERERLSKVVNKKSETNEKQKKKQKGKIFVEQKINMITILLYSRE